jgi:hypothetical protein
VVLLVLMCSARLCSFPQSAGLHSNWITDMLLAMQRPSSRGMRENRLVEKFQQAGIRAVINCTMHGEHPYCG